MVEKIWVGSNLRRPMPTIFVIAGPNGAGKTTYAKRFLPGEMRLREFLNADMIAGGLSPFAPDKAAFEAGRLLLTRVRALVAACEDFSLETTLSGTTYAGLFRSMRAAGYEIRLDYLWIGDPGITKERIIQRVAKGGHDIPDEVQRRRFRIGIRNLLTHYRPLLDRWRLFDNTDLVPHLIAQESGGRFHVADALRLARVESESEVSFMQKPPQPAVEEPGLFTRDEETRAAIRAMRKAYADAVLENLRWGLPIIQMRDGKVTAVPAEELAPYARRILAANGEPLPEETAQPKS